MSETPAAPPSFDRVIHERARLIILTYLASANAPAVGFTTLKDALDLTAGNLSVQISNLESAGYVKTEKTFKDKKPFTLVSITPAGAKALKAYLDTMESIIRQFK
jgi:DNA-binding MarR family transcriptional regulator